MANKTTTDQVEARKDDRATRLHREIAELTSSRAIALNQVEAERIDKAIQALKRALAKLQ
jgi:hypothetical protein